MKKVILDTNIYGEIVIDNDIDIIKENIRKNFIIYGFKIVRNELRSVPKTHRVGDHGLRVSLLELYDEIVGEKECMVTKNIENVARSYYDTYREFGGSKSFETIVKDFIIVACASINNMDIVVSEDEKSMLTENAVRSYKLVNTILKITTPNFIGYEEFKKLLGGR